jgi:hypothetical protein
MATAQSGLDTQDGRSHRLLRPLKLRDGTTLQDLADGRAFLRQLSEDQRSRLSWQEATRLIGEACDSGQVAAATDKLERALFLNYFLELKG